VDRPAPEEYHPPLRLWSHVWRIALTLVIGHQRAGVAAGERGPGGSSELWRAVDIALGAAAYIALLTDRERDVALAVGKGWSNAEIARDLYLSVPTVKAHVSRLFDKLQVTNRVQIAICVHDAGLA
jgi:DNA-binding NarL/FixJ family response regulator